MFEYKLSWWEKIYFPCLRFGRKFNPKDRYRDVKHFIQRGRRGYDDTTWWNIDHHLDKILPPMLRKLAKDGIGFHPLEDTDYEKMQINDDNWRAEAKRWENALLKAANDIEAYYKHDEKDFPKTKKAQEKYIRDRQASIEHTKEGMHFVAEHFLSLWD